MLDQAGLAQVQVVTCLFESKLSKQGRTQLVCLRVGLQ
jgi:hypothetical protein